MNFSRRPLASYREWNNKATKKYPLASRNPKIRDKKQNPESENDAAMANRDLSIYDYRNIRACDSESSSSDSQNYKLYLSDSMSTQSFKKSSSYREVNNDLSHIQRKTDITVIVSDSHSSSNENSPQEVVRNKPRAFTPFYRSPRKNVDRPIATIILDSSDSERESSLSKEQSRGISLHSNDDSVLHTIALKNNQHSAFDQLKSSTYNSRITDDLSSSSAESSQKDVLPRNSKSKDKKTSQHNINMEGPTASAASSSTYFSQFSNIVQGNNRQNDFHIISESSSSDNDESPVLRGLTNQKRGNNNGKLFSSTSKLSNKIATNEHSSRINTSGDRDLVDTTCRSNTRSILLSKAYDSVKLTKKDAQKIFVAGKTSSNPRWTPKVCSEFAKLESELISSQSQDKVTDIKSKKIINETPSDFVMSQSGSDEEIITNSPSDLKPTKTHVSRFIDTPKQDEAFSKLSDRKKNEISRWLANNTPGSSSSSSIISESNRNSSSGNSSLERFEMKYETPNNRGKISKAISSAEVNKAQSPLDHLIYKGKTSVFKYNTPTGVKGQEKTTVNQLTIPQFFDSTSADKTVAVNKKDIPVITEVQKLNIEDCQDILDKLYGNVWRDKANAVLTPQSEIQTRKHKVIRKQNKTERKPTIGKFSKNPEIVMSSSEDDEFDAFIKDIRPNFNSTKKKVGAQGSRNSFINDKSPSEHSSESFYQTALTNPRESKNTRTHVPAPLSAMTQRAIAICDSESENEDDIAPITRTDLVKKRLSFSEDDSSSSTSEFDPGELVLPKPKAKKAPVKKPQQKFTSATIHLATNQGLNKTKAKSFLASLSLSVPISDCHPEAKMFRQNYTNTKEQLCQRLFKLYNKEIFDDKLPHDMLIEWNVRMRGTAGFCYNKKSVKALGGIVRSSRIVLATKILDTADRLRDTLVHEMCHAAAWLINNVSDGHGPYWKGWASKAMKVFPDLPPIRRCHDYKIKTKFTYRCTSCGYSIGRHSKSLNIETKRCGHCYGKFELLVNRTTRSGTAQIATPVQARTPNGFALFVKENYHTVKKDRRSIKHGEIMKILGQKFAAIKIRQKTSNDPEK